MMNGMGGLFDLTIVVVVVVVWYLIELRVKRLDKKPPTKDSAPKDDKRAN